MASITLKIPVEFIRERAQLSWRDLEFGMANQLISADVSIEFAMDEAANLDAPSHALSALAESSINDSIVTLVDALAASEPAPDETLIKRKWLYLSLAWVYERRMSLQNPLRLVESLVADFGYQEETLNLLEYTPRQPGDRRSIEENWEQYLDDREAEFEPR